LTQGFITDERIVHANVIMSVISPGLSDVPETTTVRARLLRRVGTALWRFASRSPLSAFWGIVAVAIIGIAVAAPLIAPFEPLKSDFRHMTNPPGSLHWFGTDQIGRDTLTRVIYGSRASLAVAFGAVLLGTTTGALWGLTSGFFGGRFDLISQRIIEFLQSFPDLILAMAISMALGAGTSTVIVAIAITRIPFGGRIIRSVVLSLKEMSYVEAARGLGASNLRLMARHILPQCIAPYLILATTHLGVAIIIEASLGFLGVGIPPPMPTWGNMLADALNSGLVPPWWLVLFPGAAITLTVLAFNLLGDGIRDALDPRLRGAL
jgi:ABC-type dipeptide/oligopeptide/nickel transport system permease subunit